jgi:hypothetical protein
MARWWWLFALTAACLACAGCREVPKGKKPDPTKGRVTGTVICADTGKPARFAWVVLSAYPKADDKPDNDNALPETESAMTGLDGRFTMEAVEPGRYFAFARLEGYLDPKVSVDLSRLGDKATGQQRILDAIDQWKDHLVEVTVNVSITSDVTLRVERGAEIEGTIKYDDGSPAIGVWVELFRKTEKKAWMEAGGATGSAYAPTSDSHGRYSLTNMPAGEYIACVQLPAESEDIALRVCYPSAFRKKDAEAIKVSPGQVESGVDIVIPLSGLQTVTGQVTGIPSGHVPDRATVRLLYADDREPAREATLVLEGSFTFPYVPDGKYILQVSAAEDLEQKVEKLNPDGSVWLNPDGDLQMVAVPGSAHRYADKEMPVTVEEDMDDLQITLTPVPPAGP